MYKILNSFLLSLLLVSSTQAGISERIIYAVDTLLASTCTITQTGPMELTILPCTFTTTGDSKILSVFNSLPAHTGLGELARAIRQGKAQWTPGGLRLRVWFQDKQGKVIEKSVTYHLLTTNTITVSPGNTYFIYLIKTARTTMKAWLVLESEPRPTGYINDLVSEFTVPLATTNLTNIEIKVFTVRPDFPPAKGMFEK